MAPTRFFISRVTNWQLPHFYPPSMVRRSQNVSRSYSSEETNAWAQRPHGCSDLGTAKLLYEEKQHPANRKLFAPLQTKGIQHTTYPEWCYKHEHPLKTGRKGVLYHRMDFIGPIVDSMRELSTSASSDAFGLSSYISSKRRKTKRVELPSIEAPSDGAKKPSKVRFWTCRGCGTSDRSLLTLDREGYTCSCGAWCGTEVVRSNRQKLGASEEDDKTITSDGVFKSKTDRYDRSPKTAQEARAERLGRGKASGGLGGKRVGRHMGRLCDAQAATEREAARSIVDAEVAAGIAIQPRERVKQRAVLTYVEDLLSMLHPVDHEVKRAARITADYTYVTAVQHCGQCPESTACEYRLADRNAAAIAQAVVEYTVTRLVNKQDPDKRFDMQRLQDLQTRMQRSPCLVGKTSVSQIAASKLTVVAINQPTFDYNTVCQPCNTELSEMPKLQGPSLVSSLEGCKRAASLRPINSPCFQRSLSLVSTGTASPTPSTQIKIRNAVNAMFVAHRTELTVAVRDGALRAIQTPGFVAAYESDDKIKSLNDNQLAFCLLNAIAIDQAEASSFSRLIRPNAGIAERLALGLLDADDAIANLRASIPADAASDQSEREAEDLFH